MSGAKQQSGQLSDLDAAGGHVDDRDDVGDEGHEDLRAVGLHNQDVLGRQMQHVRDDPDPGAVRGGGREPAQLVVVVLLRVVRTLVHRYVDSQLYSAQPLGGIAVG